MPRVRVLRQNDRGERYRAQHATRACSASGGSGDIRRTAARRWFNSEWRIRRWFFVSRRFCRVEEEELGTVRGKHVDLTWCRWRMFLGIFEAHIAGIGGRTK